MWFFQVSMMSIPLIHMKRILTCQFFLQFKQFRLTLPQLTNFTPNKSNNGKLITEDSLQTSRGLESLIVSISQSTSTASLKREF